jgi:hypothetical protein
MTTDASVFATLDDRPLLEMAKRLAIDERRATAALLRALVEIDRRCLYLGEGCASLFTYCTQVLHLSEGGAYNRIEAARAARSYPVILTLIEESAITLTAVRLLAPHLSAENHVAVLAEARHQSKRQVEVLVASLRPKPDAPTVVRKVPNGPLTLRVGLTEPNATAAAGQSAAVATQAATGGLAPGTTGATSPTTTPEACVPAASTAATMPSLPLTRVTPLSAERYRLQLTMSRETHDRFRRAQALLRHAVPSGDAAEILDRALRLLVEELERTRFAETSRPRAKAPPRPSSRHVPAAVRREVWRRDGGRCAFVGAEGRCRETAFLEFHHVEPYAAGGPATVENIQVRCSAHNRYEAQLSFGPSILREHPLTPGARQPSRGT